MNRTSLAPLAVAACLFSAAPATAADHEFELWLNPSVSTALSENTSLELDTAQRFRRDPVADTYYLRLSVNHDLSDQFEVSGGVQRQWDGDRRELRLIEQLGYRHGIFRGRTRLEQRFIRNGDQTGWRLRQRVGVSVPLSKAKGDLTFIANAEGLFTLRPTSEGGDKGLTGVRTIVGLEREFGKVGVTLGYLRQQNVNSGAPDRIAHAPLIGIEFGL